jgi:pilus assembly protein FimV
MALNNAHGIGLGDIKLHSALNEPLRAEIKLIDVKDLTENQIIVDLAPADDFTRAHVDRDFMLNSLRFRLDLDNPRDPKVVVTTQQPIREPFLNFLVEVQWPSGRLLREYTLLMDLPAYSPSSAPAPVESPEVRTYSVPKPAKVSPPPAEPRPTPKIQPSVVTEPPHHVEQKVKPQPPAPTPVAEKPATDKVSAAAASGETYGPTRTNDTLWHIAKSVQGKGSIQQKLLAIQRLNPSAFSRNNVNLLKTGKVLRLPSQEEIASLSRADAMAKMREQETAWKTGATLPPPAPAQLDATGRAQPAAPTAPPVDGQLKLATPTPAVSTAANAAKGSGDTGANELAVLQNNLAIGMEELNRLQREGQDAASRIKDLDAQKDSSQKLLELQSKELAALQAKLAAEQQAKAEANAQAKAAAEAQAKAEADAQAKAAAEAQAKAEADAQAKAAASAAAQQQPAPTSQSAAGSTTAANAEAAKPAAQPVVEQPKPKAKPPVQPQPVEEPSLLDNLMGNPAIAGAVALVVVLLGLFGYRKRATRQAATDADEDIPVDVFEPALDEDRTEEHEAVTQSDTAYESADNEQDLAALFDEPVQEAADAAPEQHVQPESGDVLGEADIYISFGNFDKGEALLKSAINAEPSRIDYRMKLLELHKEARNLPAFDVAYKDLIELDDDAAIAKAGTLRAAIPGAADSPFAFGVSSAAAAEGITDEVDLDFDLDFEQFETSENTAPTIDTAPPAAPTLDLTADEPEIVEAAAPAVEDQAFDLDFDLDSTIDSPNQTSVREAISVDKTEEVEAITAGDNTEDGEFSLDFDLDLEEPAVEATPVAEPKLDLTDVAAEPEQKEEPYSPESAALLDAVTADAGDIDEELDFLSDADEAATKLDLARAYIDMGDKEGARDILAEVLDEGRDEQKREAQALLDSI